MARVSIGVVALVAVVLLFGGASETTHICAVCGARQGAQRITVAFLPVYRHTGITDTPISTLMARHFGPCDHRFALGSVGSGRFLGPRREGSGSAGYLLAHRDYPNGEIQDLDYGEWQWHKTVQRLPDDKQREVLQATRGSDNETGLFAHALVYGCSHLIASGAGDGALEAYWEQYHHLLARVDDRERAKELAEAYVHDPDPFIAAYAKELAAGFEGSDYGYSWSVDYAKRVQSANE